MAITREKKQEWIKQYADLMENSAAMVFTRANGVTVNQITQLRGKVRDTGATYLVIKNTLFARALEQTGKSVPDFLQGVLAVTFCGEDIAPSVKALEEFQDSLGEQLFAFVGGIVGEDVLDAKDAQKLASLPSRDMLFAQLLAGIHAPATQLAGTIQSGIRQVVSVLQARVDQLTEEAV